ncbi:MAG: HAD family phosphatase [Alphaproteobacteria bacterium]|nr:HAD family phosphatase [Alphaproteobacteria bacterium]
MKSCCGDGLSRRVDGRTIVRPRAVLFDLGGVLIETIGTAEIARLTGRADGAAIWRQWLASPWVQRFEAGRCAPEEFATGFIAEDGFDLAPEAFLASFRGWITHAFPGALDLIAEVGKRAITGCLSNTNALHMASNADLRALIAACERRFLSYEIGHVKPDSAIFAHAIAALGLAPAEILFLDDNEPNVAAARRLDIAAVQVKGIGAARAALTELGLTEAA